MKWQIFWQWHLKKDFNINIKPYTNIILSSKKSFILIIICLPEEGPKLYAIHFFHQRKLRFFYWTFICKKWFILKAKLVFSTIPNPFLWNEKIIIYCIFYCFRPGDGFVPNFDMFEKTDVNGKNQNPIYTFLKVI